MTAFTPLDPGYDQRVRNTFAAQTFMTTIGARIALVEPGAVDLTMDERNDLCQQDGFLHAGVTTALADSAAGFAAYSLFGPEDHVLTTEFKFNLLRPAAGATFVARGRVVKPGRTLTICRSDFYGSRDGRESHIATALLTMIAVGKP